MKRLPATRTSQPDPHRPRRGPGSRRLADRTLRGGRLRAARRRGGAPDPAGPSVRTAHPRQRATARAARAAATAL
jgi:hypothetical protein